MTEALRTSKQVFDRITYMMKDIKELPNKEAGREIALTYTKLEEAKLWLSVVIQKLEDLENE